MADVSRSHNLDGALDELQDAVFTALEMGGLILKQEMQRLAPIDTGRMTRSVHVTDPQREGDEFVIRVGPTVDYAKYTELEPWIIGKRPGPKSQLKGATIPWIKPAVENVRDEVVEIITGGVRTAVRALAAKYHP